MSKPPCPVHDQLETLIEVKLKAISENIDLKMTAMHGEMKSGFDILDMHLDEIKAMQDNTLGRVERLETTSDFRKPLDWFVKNFRTALILLAIFIVIVGSLDFKQIVDLIKHF